MEPNDGQVILDGPRTLFLDANTIALILDSLSDRPHKIAHGPISEILKQLRAQQPSGSAGRPAGDPNGIPGKGDVKTDINNGVDIGTAG